MKHERTENLKKRYPINPQSRPDYRDDDEYLPGQRRQLIEAQEDSEADAQIANPTEGSGGRVKQPQLDRQLDQSSRQDAQTREDIQRAEQEGMVKHKEANRAEGSDKSRQQPKDLSAQRSRGDTSVKQHKPKSQGKSSTRRQQGTSSRHH